MLGALVGAVAWWMAQVLLLSLPTNPEVFIGPDDTGVAAMLGWRNESLDRAFESGSVAMPLPMFAAYFAFLFAVVRWWRMAEWTRSSQVSLWAVGWCAFIGWAVSMFWWFPQPLGILLVAAIAFTVQLSSPWLSPSRRKEMAQALVA
jgi:hypothetical protein